MRKLQQLYHNPHVHKLNVNADWRKAKINHWSTGNSTEIYGSSRLGIYKVDSVLWNNGVTPTISNKYSQKLGLKRYELSNHLGNVSTVISDRKLVDLHANGQITAYKVDIVSVTDYYAYGMKIAERSWGKDARYQYNGKEQDKGMGRYNFDGRMYDERSCRWMSLDPQAAKYAGISPYVGFANNPIMFVDPDGEEIIIQINGEKNKGFRQIRYNVDGSLSERISKDGKIVYVNYKAPAGSYEAKVQAQLDYLRTMNNDEIKTRMNVLQSSTNMHIIRAPKEGKNAHNENEGDKENSSFVNKWEDYGTSTGSGSHYDPLNWVTARGDEKPPVVTLTHELLGHGYGREIGKSVVIKTGKLSSNGNDILFEEVLAVRVENIVRAYMHKEFEKSKTDIGIKIFKNTNPRTTYGGTDIQSELDKIEKDKVGFPQPRKK